MFRLETPASMATNTAVNGFFLPQPQLDIVLWSSEKDIQCFFLYIYTCIYVVHTGRQKDALDRLCILCATVCLVSLMHKKTRTITTNRSITVICTTNNETRVCVQGMISNNFPPSPFYDVPGPPLQHANLDTLSPADPSGPTAPSSSAQEAPCIMHHYPGLFRSGEAKNSEKHRASRAPAISPTVAHVSVENEVSFRPYGITKRNT